MRKTHHYDYLYEFDTITNEIEAYTLGLMIADGNISQNMQQSKIGLHREDLYLLEQIRDYVCPAIQITDDKICKVVRFSNTRLNMNLLQYGVAPNKVVLNKSLPKLEAGLMRHLLRGIFDGDGSVTTHRDFIRIVIGCIDGQLINEICMHFNEIGVFSTVNVERRKGKVFNKVHSEGTTTDYKDLYRVYVRRKSAVCTLYEYLYKDSTIYMRRKQEKFKLHVDTVLRAAITKGAATV